MSALACAIGCGRVDFDAPRPPPRVLLYGDPVSGTTEFQALVASYAASVANTVDSTPMSAAVLADVDLVIAQHLQVNHTPAESDVLVAWVASGGTFVSMTGYNAVANPNESDLIVSFGVQYGTPFIDGPVTTFAPHPLAATVASLPFMGGHEVTHGAALSDLASISGVPVAAVAPRVLIWGDEWISLDMGWSPETARFWTNVFTAF